MPEFTRLSANLYVDIAYTGHVRYKNTNLLTVLRTSLAHLDGLHQAKVLATLNDHEHKLYITRTEFTVLKSILIRYIQKLIHNDVLTAESAAMLNLEVSEFEQRADELTKEYMSNNTGGNYEEVERPVS